MLAQIIAPSRHTVTSLITTFGKQYQDWSADYALYAKNRVDPQVLFDEVRKEIEDFKSPDQPLCVAIDDTILRKSGRCIPGCAYRKDPLGPAFNLNLVWSQRFVQLSGAAPLENDEVRMIPIAFEDASTPRKPRKNSPPEHFQAYKEMRKQRNLNSIALKALEHLQDNRSQNKEARKPPIHALTDGSYTNRAFMRHLPENTIQIGRIRKDARLNQKPSDQASRGRRRFYGPPMATPEEILKDPSIAWIEVKIKAAGVWHNFKVKCIQNIRWRVCGQKDLQLVVIQPLGYRLKKCGKLLYRQPAYLICTDPQLALDQLIQEYIWRWDIEVNHRDEKTLLGLGQAQVRNENSVSLLPATAVASYSMLHMAAIKAYGPSGQPTAIPPAKWRDPEKKSRASTQDLINEMRRELWATAVRPDILNDFMNQSQPDTKWDKSQPNPCNSLFAANA